MKEVLRFMVSLVFIFMLVGCNSKKEQKISRGKHSTSKIQVLKEVKDLDTKFEHKTKTLGYTDYPASVVEPAYDGDYAYFANDRGRVAAYNLIDDKYKWTVRVDKYLVGGITLSDKYLYVSDNHGYFTALNKEDGSEVYRVQLNTEVIPGSIYSSDSGLVILKGLNGSVMAIEADTGVLRWNYVSDAKSLVVRGLSTMTLLKDQLLVGLPSGKLTSIDVETGKVDWEILVADSEGDTDLQRLNDISSKPFVYRNYVYVSVINGYVASIGRYTGKLNWLREYKVDDKVVADKSRVYFSQAKEGIRALDSKSGESLWVQDKFAPREMLGPVLYKDKLIVVDELNYVYFLEASDGEITAKFKPGFKISDLSLVNKDKLYILTDNARVLVYDLANMDL